MQFFTKSEAVAIGIGITLVYLLYFHGMDLNFGIEKTLLVSSTPLGSVLFKVWYRNRKAVPVQ